MNEPEFWSRVVKQPDGCWLWTGARTSAGYGNVRFKGRYWSAHRLSYSLGHGLPPDHLKMDHLCRVRLCVNPAHLEPVTDRVNILRGVGPSAFHAVKTHCPQGHEYDLLNTYVTSKGIRQCRECHRVRYRASRSA